MSKNPFGLSEALYEYSKVLTLSETREQQVLRETTQKMEMALMQISPDQGQFMQMLVALIGARYIVEVGTFTGYSALSMALALPDDGKLVACDISTEWTNVGKPFWEQAGVANKIDLRIGSAANTLDQLLEQGDAGKVDLMFIDADKTGYMDYYEKGIELLRLNGLIVVDNVFWGGKVIDDAVEDDDTKAIREINKHISTDSRVQSAMIAVGDGLFLARKI